MTKPLRVFVGNSCVGSSHAGGEEEFGQGKAVEYATGQWNISNNTLVSVPTDNMCRVGEYNHARDWNSLFTLSWAWTGGYEGKAVSAHGKRAGNVRLGEVTLTLPLVTFRGKDTCRDLRKIMTADFLDSC